MNTQEKIFFLRTKWQSMSQKYNIFIYNFQPRIQPYNQESTTSIDLALSGARPADELIIGSNDDTTI